MTFVPEPELYSFVLYGYHLFSECLPSAWIGDINHIIGEMNVSGFAQFRYPNVKMEPTLCLRLLCRYMLIVLRRSPDNLRGHWWVQVDANLA